VIASVAAKFIRDEFLANGLSRRQIRAYQSKYGLDRRDAGSTQRDGAPKNAKNRSCE
jgi:hypothetical protein